MRTSVATKLVDQADELDAAMGVIIEAARADPAVFCQFVLRDEATGSPINLAPVHEEWHDILNQRNRVVIWSATELGKTAQISIGRVLWEIGKDPNIRILIIGAASGVAKKIVKAIKTYIEHSAEFRAVFPQVVPDKSDTTGRWRDDSFNVRRTTKSKDPTVQAVGYGGNVLGARLDLIIADDYLTPENTYSDHQRDKSHGWLKSVIEGRKTARARLWFIGNAWHLDDAMHRYAAEELTFSKKFPVRNDNTGASVWPEVWPDERIETEIKNRGPIESRRSMFCDPVSDADRRFKSEYIVKALQLGDGLELAWALSVVPNGYRTITGVDLAVSKKDAADWTAMTTIAVEERTSSRQVLDITAGKMDGPQIVQKIIEIHERYHSIVWVESNAAQAYIKQFVNDQSAVPVRAFFTGRNKIDPSFGIESLAVEMSQGKWVFPNHGGTLTGRMDPEMRKLISELVRYDPASHTGDRLMSMWLAREGARKSFGGAGVGKRARRT
jgi:hypothetical protein